MKKATLFAVTFCSLALVVLGQGGSYGPTLVVIVDSYQFDQREIEKLDRRLDERIHKKNLGIRYAIDYGHFDGEADYYAEIERLRGYEPDRCGVFNRTHYVWTVYDARDRRLRSGHEHKLRHAAKEILKTVDRDWR